MSQTKFCKSCELEKSTSSFYTNKRSSDGFAYYCKACAKRKSLEYYYRNRDKCNQCNKDWLRARPEYVRSKKSSYYWNNRDEELARTAQWKAQNPERWRTISKRAWHKRRALTQRTYVENVDIDELITRDSGMCGICNEHVDFGEDAIDHVVPISKGGEHSYRNTQLAHSICNSRKGSRMVCLIG